MLDSITRELLLVAVALVTDAPAPVAAKQQPACTASSPVSTACPRTAADEAAYGLLIQKLSRQSKE